MLIHRIITAIILIAIFLLGNFWVSEPAFLLFVTVIAAMCAWEWSALGGLTKTFHRYIYIAILLILISLCYLVKDSWGLGLIAFCTLWWGFKLVLLVTGKMSDDKEKILLSGIWVLSITWLAIALIHEQSPMLLLAGLVLVWGADSFAYFAGRKFGKTKLAPAISPGKTVEGVIGGSAGVFILALILAFVLEIESGNMIWWLLGAILMSLISVVGDLYESWLKRNAGVKDSGNILPGHGGLLDRIDGVVAVLPFYYLLINWLFNSA